MKIVINSDYGGFGLSDLAIKRYFEIKGWNCVYKTDQFGTLFYRDEISPDTFFSEYDLKRDDSVLVQVVEELGLQANTKYSDLKVVEIPEEVDWYIEEFDGCEHVAETHRRWF